MEAVTGSLGGLGGGSLPTGANDLAPNAPQAAAPDTGLGVQPF